MANTIRRNIWKVPADIGLVVGVPRSGMICALMIAELLNKPVTDIDSFLDGKTWQSGHRGKSMKSELNAIKVLVIDDTFYMGSAMRKAKNKLRSIEDKYNIIYGCVYAEGEGSTNKVDLYFEYNYNPKEEGFFLYEWNMMHHNFRHSKWMMFDLDGVICKNPPNDKDTVSYENYISNAIPMIIPSSKIGGICTYRIEKYRKVTEEWLGRNNVEYLELVMFPANSSEERNSKQCSSRFKANIYKNAEWAKLYVESDPHQAERIFKLSGKPVFCYENGRLYI